MADPDVTLKFKLTHDEAMELARLIHRVTPSRLHALMWKSQGDDDTTIARWARALHRLADALEQQGYAVRSDR